MVHTDLKPENILLVHAAFVPSGRGTKRLASCQVKLADFGSAVFDWQAHPPLVAARPYRAPEVLLGLFFFF